MPDPFVRDTHPNLPGGSGRSQATGPDNVPGGTPSTMGGSIMHGVRYVIRNIDPRTWFGPAQPIQPVAQEAKGRLWQYPVGYNLQLTPRSTEGITFASLHALADNLDLVRIAIETRKDQIERSDWYIKVRGDRARPTEEQRVRIDRIVTFLQRPDGVHPFKTWLRAGVEDVLTVDALTIEPVFDLTGRLARLDLVDGSTIIPRLDEKGRQPAPPDVAFQQSLHGVPAVDFNSDELLYCVRNVRPGHVYGFSPVEQIILTINTVLRRELWRLQEYTEGTVPDAIAEVPEGWTQENVRDFQAWWDGLHEGNSAQRRKMRFVPALKQLHFPKAAVLKDQADEWLARIICWAFSLPPNALVAAVNKATAEAAQQEAADDGLLTIKAWLKDAVLDWIIVKYFESPDLEFAWREAQLTRLKDKAEADAVLVRIGVRSIDEVRDEMGLDGVGMGPMIFLSSGVLPVEQIKAGQYALPGGMAPGVPQVESMQPHSHEGVPPEAEVEQRVLRASALSRIAALRKRWPAPAPR